MGMRFLVVIAVVAALSGSARAGELPPERIAPLMEQLGVGGFDARQAAELELLSLGTDALLPLRRFVRATQDAEMRRRAQGVVEAIEDMAGIAPTRVSLKAQGLPLSIVLNDLTEQTGFQMTLNRGGRVEPPVTLEVVRQPLWMVLRELSRQTGWGITRGQSNRRPTFTFAQGGRLFGEAPVADAGCLLVMVRRVELAETLEYGSSAAPNRQLRVMLSLFPDPRLNLTQVASGLEQVRAVDDRGLSLALPAAAPPGMMRLAATAASWDVTVPLAVRPDAGRTVDLQAGVRISVPAATETWESNQLALGTHQFGGGATAEVTNLSRAGNNYTIRVAVTGMAPPAENAIERAVRLVDDQGADLAGTTSLSNTSTNSFQLSATFNAAEGGTVRRPARMLIALPTVREMPIAFELLGVPLP
jgi:hypothetical protein